MALRSGFPIFPASLVFNSIKFQPALKFFRFQFLHLCLYLEIKIQNMICKSRYRGIKRIWFTIIFFPDDLERATYDCGPPGGRIDEGCQTIATARDKIEFCICEGHLCNGAVTVKYGAGLVTMAVIVAAGLMKWTCPDGSSGVTLVINKKFFWNAILSKQKLTIKLYWQCTHRVLLLLVLHEEHTGS